MKTVTARRLHLNKLKFGSLDARTEVLSRDAESLAHFRESFIEPVGFSVDQFLKGKKYVVYGMKGSGKTAFLRYTQIKAEEEHSLTKFVTFSSQISDSQKEKLIKSSMFENYKIDEIDQAITTTTTAWILFIFQQIARIVEENRHAFTSHQDLKHFLDLMRKLSGEDPETLFSWLIKVAKKGKYKIETKYIKAEVQGADGEKEVIFDIDFILDQAMAFLKSISWEGPKGIYIFFDELNLSFSSRNQHKKDSILIRDLIVAVNRVNEFFIENEKPLFVAAAVRTEVLNTISTPTHEINKIMHDCGAELRWYAPTAGNKPPILALFESKIRASEKLAKSVISQNVFESYFRNSIYGMAPQSFIVDMTWCNPRDLVLLFGDSAKRAINDEFFDEILISKALDSYSKNAWMEKIEELNVTYAPAEIKSLKTILTDFRKYFKLSDFESEGDRKGRADQSISFFLSKRPAAKILEDLYRIGIIGQSTKRPFDHGTSIKQFQEHWVCRGDTNFDPTAYMVIHKSLWADLRLGQIRANF